MTLSVIVPFYNVELYFEDCLASIARQDLEDFHVVLVDDGSQDSSREIAEKYVAADDRFTILTQENQGLGPARNTGMRAATGEFLTFIDSDDIVPQGAWTRMVDRLLRSGSQIAAGDAQRFNIHGVRDSWVHIEPFATDRFGTSVREYPALASDRMVWNKIYRRDFWEDRGYAFPAIMYEDYPVTLKAHLEAESVEVVSTPIYMWRERDAGASSITQSLYEARNVADRVTSALMVFDLLRDQPPSICRVVHDLLVTTDFHAIARAVMLGAAGPDRESFVAEAQRFAAHLDPELIRERRPLERLLYHLMRQGRVDELSAVIATGDRLLPPPGHTVSPTAPDRRLITIDGTDLDDVPERWRGLRERELDLTGRVLEAGWDAERTDVLRLDLEVRLNFGNDPQEVELRSWLRSRRRAGDLEIRVLPGHRVHRDAICFSVEIPAADVLDRSGTENELHPWTVWVELVQDGLTRSAAITGAVEGTATFGAPWQPDDWTCVQPGRLNGRYVVNVIRRAAVIEQVRADRPGEFVLDGRAIRPLDPGTAVRLRLQENQLDRLLPVLVHGEDDRRWTTHVHLGSLSSSGFDPLVPHVRRWTVDLVDRRSEQPLTLSPALSDTRASAGDQEASLSSNVFHAARLTVTNRSYVVERVDVPAPGRLVMAGRWLDGEDADDLVMQWLDPVGELQEYRPEHRRTAEGWWETTIDLAAVVEHTRSALAEDLVAALDQAPVVWDLSLPHQGHPSSVHLTGSALRRVRPYVIDGLCEVSLVTHRHLAARILISPVPR